MFTAVLSVLALSPAPDAFARYNAYMAAHPQLSVTMSTTVEGAPGPTGTLTIQRPSNILYHAFFRGDDYSVSTTTQGYVEIDRLTKVYDEFPAQIPFTIYPSEISSAMAGVAPRMLLMADFKKVFPSKTKVISDTDPTKLHFLQKNQEGEVELNATVDMSGRLTYFSRRTRGMAGNMNVQWQFSNFRDVAGIKLAAFSTPLPMGFVPHSVPRVETPLEKGQAVPTGPWKSPNGRKVDFGQLSGGKPYVIAYLGDLDGPAAASRPFIDQLAKTVPVFVVSPTGFSDPTGRLVAALNPPGSPMFYLVRQGKVAGLWLGYSVAGRDALTQEIIQAAAGTPTPKK